MARHHGQRGKIYLAPGSGEAVLVTTLSAWTLDMKTDKVDVTAFNDTNKISVTGLPELSGTFSGFYDETDATIFSAADAAKAGTSAKMYIYPDSSAMTKYAYGLAWVDASLAGAVNGAVTISGTWTAAGAWETGLL